MNTLYRRIHRVVRHIPRGRVVTYGVVARLAGRPGAARTVGWALSALPEDTDVPWWRVVNSAGRLVPGHEREQAAQLRGEGVRVAAGRVRTAPVGRFAVRKPGGLPSVP